MVPAAIQDASEFIKNVAYRIVTFFDGPFQTTSAILGSILHVVLVLQPRQASSLEPASCSAFAATRESIFLFSSCRYDVSPSAPLLMSYIHSIGTPYKGAIPHSKS